MFIKTHFLNQFKQGALIGALLVSGCVTTTNVKKKPQKNIEPVVLVRTGVGGAAVPAGGAGASSPSNAQADNSNPVPKPPEVPATCQSKLQDSLCEAMMFHYAFQNSFPRKLEDLIGFQGVSSQMDLRCPVSGKPYIYNPDSTIVLDSKIWREDASAEGPRAVAQNLRYKVILYDSEPHGAFRNAILKLIKVDDNGTEIPNLDNPSLYVIPIPEDQFRLKLNLP